ncbi:hypothetical protein [Paracoccus sanguinis]|uniref:hypothetical protein n=1 Tax=Paracoccus sanguinis TaxID=1545044 RepID=UPI00145194A2|nr:hypothetical protein [Paracoccus sanguinis]QJD17790.1 hypothetical protein HGN31_13560 [Paracoccus sanguinis]
MSLPGRTIEEENDMKASKLTPTTLTGLALVVALAAPLAAQNFPEEIDVMRRIAASFDTNNDDKIDRDEFREFTRLVWASMDSNNDGQVDEAEFMAWDPGFSYVAELNGKSEDFTSMKQEIFAYWDANGDKIATRDEVLATADDEFKNSDPDGDGFVTGRDLAFGSPTFSAFIFGAGPAK